MLSPYDTTIGRVEDVKGLELAVETARIESGLVPGFVEGYPSIYVIVTETPSIDFFPHPFTYESKVDRKIYTVVDLRPYKDQIRQITPKTYSTPATGAVPLNLMRAKLQHIWYTNKITDFSDIGNLPIAVFSSWVAETVGRNLAMDHMAILRMRLMAAFWYIRQGERFEGEYAARDVLRIQVLLARITGIPVTKIVELMDGLPTKYNTSGEFAAALVKAGISLRLAKFNVGLLYNFMGGTWYGSANQRDVVGVALEYPPTFLALLWGALEERNRNTPLGTLVQRFGKDGETQATGRSIGLLVSNNTNRG